MHQLEVWLCLTLVLQPFLLYSASTEPLIPNDLQQWRYGHDESDLAAIAKARFWDLNMLQRASAIVNYEQMRSFVSKLKSGKPVTVVAIGDSIVANHGGCFHSSIEHLEQHLPLTDFTYIRRERCSVQGWSSSWLRNFMQLINSTWPHPDHLLINNGIPGLAFHGFAAGICLESLIPQSTDLLILEHLPYLDTNPDDLAKNTAEAAERLILRLLLQFKGSLPPIITLNMLRALHGKKIFTPENEACIRDISLCSTSPLCNTTYQQLPQSSSIIAPGELVTHALARYYGFTSLSHTTFVHSLLRDNIHGRLGMSECQLFATLFQDRVHPNEAGRVLLTDLLVSYLAASERYFATEAADPSHRPRIHRARLPPRSPLYTAKAMVPVMRCYHSNTGNTTTNSTSSGSSTVTLKEVMADGWQYHELDGDNNAVKPGWIANTTNARWRVSLDTSFPNLEPTLPANASQPPTTSQPTTDTSNEDDEQLADVPDQPATHLVVTYLMSYQHMGMAALSCKSGCTCEKTVMDAHDTLDKHSIPRLHAVAVSSSPECVVQLRVLPESSSGEHKFKVMQLAVVREVDASLQLTMLRQQALLAQRNRRR